MRSRSRDTPTSRLGLISTNITTSRSRLFASRAKDVILPKLVRIKGTEYCTDFLSLSEQGVYAWSRLHVIAPYNLILCIITIVIINGRENKVTTAIIITGRPGPILTSRWRLVSGFNVSCPSLHYVELLRIVNGVFVYEDVDLTVKIQSKLSYVWFK